MNSSKPALIHDQRLVDQLSDLPKIARELVVYRVTGLATDPIAPSISGGRWAPPASGDVSFPVLYTSLVREGAIAEIERLGVDLAKYGLRDYPITQNIGAALAFLGIDGLVTPSARWDCKNLTIFSGNHRWENKLDVLDSEEIEWRAWAAANKLL
jgi:hypothetical protein